MCECFGCEVTLWTFLFALPLSKKQSMGPWHQARIKYSEEKELNLLQNKMMSRVPMSIS